MSGWLFAANVLLYAVFPLVFAALRTPLRIAFLYVYVGVVLTVGGFLGSVYSLPLVDGVTVSAGSLAYGAALFSSLVAAIVGRDLRIIRNVALIVLIVNAFTIGHFWLIEAALSGEDAVNPHDTSPQVFGTVLRQVVVGGLLTVVELLGMLAAFEWAKRRLPPWTVRPLYVVGFITVLALDGALFPVLALGAGGALAPIIVDGVRAKLVLALAYSGPLVLFLTAFRRLVDDYSATPLEFHEFLFAPRDRLLTQIAAQTAELETRERELSSTAARAERRAMISQALIDVPADAELDEQLAALTALLRRIPGVQKMPLGVWVFLGNGVVGDFGLTGTGTSAYDYDTLRERAEGSAVWIEGRGNYTAVLMRLGDAHDPDGVIEVPIDLSDASRIQAELQDLAVQITSRLRGALTRARQHWSERLPIMQVLETGALSVVFQPMLSLARQTVFCYEGLSRFEEGVSPEDRFREAARLGLSAELELLAASRIVQEARHLPIGAAVSINVSPETVLRAELANVLRPARRQVYLEVTEHEPIDDYEAFLHAVDRLPHVRLMIDDAGSGYATLRHVLELHPRFVKLDRSWVHAIHEDHPRQVLVRGLRTLTDKIGASLIAEGVERPAEANALRLLGVQYGQGHLFARPQPVQAFAFHLLGDRSRSRAAASSD